MPAVYSTAQAAKLTGASEGTIRNYARQYAGFLSAGANPPAGQPRAMTGQDLALLAFVRERTAAGVGHDAIMAQLTAGELAGFAWSPPEPAGQEAEAVGVHLEARTTQPAALVLQEVARSLAGVMAAELAQAREVSQGLAVQILDAEKRAARAEREAELRAVENAELRAELARLRSRGLAARLFNRE